MPYGFLTGTMIMIPSNVDDYINQLPDGSHKFKHRIIVKRDSKDISKVLTGFPVLNNETKVVSCFCRFKMGNREL